MKRELNLLFTAIVSYTRLPSPFTLEYSEKNMTESFRYFPFVGIIVGSLGGMLYLLLSFCFNVYIAAAGTLIGLALITGCMHEDGFADFFDGFGGGYTKERILSIMKDSHIGAFGVIALILLFLLKIMIFVSIDKTVLPGLLLSAHALSRVYPLFMINTSVYARTEASKGDYTKNRISSGSLAIAVLCGLLPLIFFPLPFFTIVLVSASSFFLLFRRYLHRKIQGFTGDTLGALQQFTEIIIFLSYMLYSNLWVV